MITNFADLSAYQRTVDLRSYAGTGRTTVALKATEGTGFTDPYFASRWAAAAAMGLTRIAYHFLHAGNGVGQAQHFLSVVGATMPSDILVCDFEAGGKASKADCLAFLQTVRQAHPTVRLLVYGPPSWIGPAGLVQSECYGAGLWQATYGNGYRLPPGWAHACAWQFTDNGPVPGVGNCDDSKVLCDMQHLYPNGEDDLSPDQDARLTRIEQAVNLLITGLNDRLNKLEGWEQWLVQAEGGRFTSLDQALAAIKAKLGA